MLLNSLKAILKFSSELSCVSSLPRLDIPSFLIVSKLEEIKETDFLKERFTNQSTDPSFLNKLDFLMLVQNEASLHQKIYH